MTTGLRKNNDFCWVNMITPRPAEAKRFFTALFGWTYVELPMVNGWEFQVQGKSVGAMFDCDDARTPKGTPPLLQPAIKLESADDFAVRAAALGGTARPPMDIFDFGRMVVCNDPDGAQLDGWQPRKNQGTDADSNAHGAPSWFQVMVRDGDRGQKFYTQLFGWKAQVFPERGGYVVFSLGDRQVAGMMQISEMTGPQEPHWSVWLSSDDVDETARRTTALGGKLCLEPHDIPDIGRFIAATSPQGVPFHAISWKR